MHLQPKKLLILGNVVRAIRALLMVAFVSVSQVAILYFVDTSFEVSANLGLVMLLVPILTTFTGAVPNFYVYPLDIYTLVLEIVILCAVVSISVLCTLSISQGTHMSHSIYYFWLSHRLACASTGLAYAMVGSSVCALIGSLVVIIVGPKCNIDRNSDYIGPNKEALDSRGTHTLRSGDIADARAEIICCNLSFCQNSGIRISDKVLTTACEELSYSGTTAPKESNASSDRASVPSTSSAGLVFSFRNSVRDSLLLRLNNVKCQPASPILPKRGTVRASILNASGSQELVVNSSRYL